MKRTVVVILMAASASAFGQAKVRKADVSVPAQLNGVAIEQWKYGHDTADILDAAQALALKSAKGQFESTNEWATRIEKTEHRAIKKGTQVSTGDLLAIKILCRIEQSSSARRSSRPCVAQYDADREQFSLSFSNARHFDNALTVELASNSKDLGSYTAQNGLGTSVVVRRIETRQDIGAIEFVDEMEAKRQRACATDKGNFGWTVGQLTDIEVAVPRATARAVPVFLDVIFVGRLTPPFFSADVLEHDPTIRIPVRETERQRFLHFKAEEMIVMNLLEARPFRIFKAMELLPCGVT